MQSYSKHTYKHIYAYACSIRLQLIMRPEKNAALTFTTAAADWFGALSANRDRATNDTLPSYEMFMCFDRMSGDGSDTVAKN